MGGEEPFRVGGVGVCGEESDVGVAAAAGCGGDDDGGQSLVVGDEQLVVIDADVVDVDDGFGVVVVAGGVRQDAGVDARGKRE